MKFNQKKLMFHYYNIYYSKNKNKKYKFYNIKT